MSSTPSIQQTPPMVKKNSEFSAIAPASHYNDIIKYETSVPQQEDKVYYNSDRINDNEKGSSSSISEEQIEHVPEGTASSGKALFMLIKAFVGTGVIFLPGS